MRVEVPEKEEAEDQNKVLAGQSQVRALKQGSVENCQQEFRLYLLAGPHSKFRSYSSVVSEIRNLRSIFRC